MASICNTCQILSAGIKHFKKKVNKQLPAGSAPKNEKNSIVKEY